MSVSKSAHNQFPPELHNIEHIIQNTKILLFDINNKISFIIDVIMINQGYPKNQGNNNNNIN